MLLSSNETFEAGICVVLIHCRHTRVEEIKQCRFYVVLSKRNSICLLSYFNLGVLCSPVDLESDFKEQRKWSLTSFCPYFQFCLFLCKKEPAFIFLIVQCLICCLRKGDLGGLIPFWQWCQHSEVDFYFVLESKKQGWVIFSVLHGSQMIYYCGSNIKRLEIVSPF